MRTVGIIGANGQVGSEVCLFLHEMEDVHPVAICRSLRSAALLERYGVECRIGHVSNPEDAGGLLRGCDVIADFSLPKGRLSEIRRQTAQLLGGVIDGSAPHVTLVYISSYMALGMQGENALARHHLIPRTPYAAAKRHGERTALQMGRAHARDVYVLRLGQVYGELQAVSRGLESEVTAAPAQIPDSVSYSVFAFTIAEALANIAARRERPGRYTVVSSPEWTWREVYEYYCARRGIRPTIVLAPAHAPPSLNPLSRAMSMPATGARLLTKLASGYRDPLSANVLWRIPSLETRLLAKYRIARARADIDSLVSQSIYKPFKIFMGDVQGRRLSSLSDCRLTMEPVAAIVREKLARLAM